MSSVRQSLAIAALGIAATACGLPPNSPVDAGTIGVGRVTTDGGSAANAGTTTSAGPATFTAVVNDVFAVSCVKCHNDSPKAAAGMSLTAANAYDQIVGVASASPDWPNQYQGMMRVDPGHPESSTLFISTHDYADLAKTAPKLKMPLAGSMLSVSQLQLLHDWIASGAPNN